MLALKRNGVSIMAYIHRDMESEITALSAEYACILLTGPRQVGKTTLLRQLSDPDRHYVTLDDLTERKLAREDPALFLQLHRCPVLIDEVQYAPELLSCIKIAIDSGAAPGAFWLTASQLFRLMNLSQESLAGRMAVLHLSGLSQHEIYGSGPCTPFMPDLPVLQARQATHPPADLYGIYERIWRGSLPGFVSGKYTNKNVFYSSYLQTYIERDVSDQIQVSDPLLFHDFIRAAACRTGQMLNVHDIAQDVGVTDDTARHWLQVLERSDVIFFLRPYSNNLLKRTVKTPKLYFFDTGLAAYLTRYTAPEILADGALNGAILENYVVSEILKSWQNRAEDCLMWYYRDKSSNEIDIVLESGGVLHPMEIKRTANPGSALLQPFQLLDRASLPRGSSAILCMRPELSAISRENYIVPIWMI